MKDSHRSIYFQCPNATTSNFSTKENCRTVGQITQPRQLNLHTGSEERPENVSFATPRCSEKGCVFPASARGQRKCTYHLHQQEEPVLFRSHQPTGMLLDPARTMPAGKFDDGSRKRDRRRMAEMWEQFQSEGAF